MIKINDECNGGGYRDGKQRTTITQPEAAINTRDRDHEQVVTTTLPLEQFPPIAVASKDDLPPEYEPLKRYID